jgi:hypothetical protein
MSRRNQVKSLTSSFYHQEELWHHFGFRLIEASSGPGPLAAEMDDEQQLRSLTVLLIDERGCGAESWGPRNNPTGAAIG